ncbi:MAG: CDP-archaeol synthase [Actinomycetales bacterium]|nr:CDP-archaeol synthase [Actinomycetales bacterium]
MDHPTVETLGRMYVSLLPVILAGILNMVWCSTGLAPALARPVDGGRVLGDGRRLFGGNKTWKGLVGMVVLGAAAAVLWGAVLAGHRAEELNLLYERHDNTVPYNALAGALLGLAYALAELPNSYLKRRLGVEPGRTADGGAKWLLVVLDQADSVIGCAVVLAVLCPVTPAFLVGLVVVGSATHLVLNLLLYAVRLRHNPF